MASFFRGPAQSSPFQQAIEKATDANQPNEDWGLIMRICDHVSEHEESGKEAMKVIRKRLQTNLAANGWQTIGLTLTLLEALTKNCGKVFHLQIAQKDFLKELGGVIAPKNNPPPAVQEKVLGMIQTWTLAFRNDPDLKNVEEYYQECIRQGFEFPPADPENAIKAAVPATGTIERPAQYARSMSQPAGGTVLRPTRSASDGSSQHVVLRQMTPEQIAKLRSELDVVQNNAQVLGEMLITLQPGEEHPQDLDFLNELYKTCKQMQSRLVELLSQISIDEITMDLLRYNDEFNNSFKTYESYMQERERRVGSTQIPISNRTASPLKTSISNSQSPTKAFSLPRQQDNEPALIKFDEEPIALATNLRSTYINSPTFDAAPKPPQQPSAASVTTRSTSNNHDPESDAKEVEQWLNVQGEKENNTDTAFNEFLEKRASANPPEPISEQQIYINLQNPSTEHQSNA